MVPERGRMPGVYPSPALAGRFRLSSLRCARRAVDDVGWTAAVPELPWADVADGWHGVSGHTQAPADMVPGDMVCHQSEEWRQCPRSAAGARPGQLRDGLDLASQVAPRDGPARAGWPHGDRRGRRNLRQRPGTRQRGRQIETKAIVAVAAEKSGRGIGRIRLRHVKDVSSDSLLAFVQGAVAPGSVVHTDGWSGYSGLAAAGYQHQVTVINDGPDPAHEVMPRVHIVASLLKRWLIGTHQGGIQHRHLDYYLDEFTFRFNHRRSRARGLLFHRLVQQAVAVGPAPYHTIVGTARDRQSALRDQ